MSRSNSLDNLSNEIARQLAMYTNKVREEVKKAADDVTKVALAEIKANSPHKTGDYAKGWTRKKAGDGYVIQNKDEYRLAHLLEYGHASSNGGHVFGTPHIRPAEEKAIAEFNRRVERVIKQ